MESGDGGFESGIGVGNRGWGFESGVGVGDGGVGLKACARSRKGEAGWAWKTAWDLKAGWVQGHYFTAVSSFQIAVEYSVHCPWVGDR